MNILATACARLRLPLLLAGAVLTLSPRLGHVLTLGWHPPVWLGVGTVLVGFALYARLVPRRGRAHPVLPPVRGHWLALHSPADHVPSHGVVAYGQSHAVDLVHVPTSGADAGRSPGERRWRSWHPRPETFSGFGEPVVAVADGEVVAVSDWQPDARAWFGPVGLAVFMLLGAIRELGGSRFVLGNRVVIRIAPDTYAVVAHLRRHSARVRRGDRVLAGQQIAEVGNTGNSTEPHVHVHLQDRPWPWFAAGLPMTFIRPDGTTGMPAAREPVPQAEPAAPPRTRPVATAR
jgi:hypothetical protein